MNPGERRKAGREHAAAKRYAEALHEYVWFHEHALEHGPAWYGVRLSYALSDWMELAEHHPEARTTLVVIRDRKTAQLLRGEGTRELFHDVAAIDGHLGEPAHAHDLFRRLADLDPSFAMKCSSIARPILVAAGDHDLAARFLPPLDDYVRSLANQCNERVRDLQSRPGPSGPEETLRVAMLFGAEASVYADAVRDLLTVLDRTGRSNEAVRLRGLALELVVDESMREKIRLLLT